MLTALHRRRQAGLTLIEIIAAIAILGILATVAIPVARWDHKRRKEKQLKVHLHQMRQAIDLYRSYVLDGKIVQEDVEQEGWPLDLEELVEGVEVGEPESPNRAVTTFLREIPVDPFTGEAEWGMRSYQDEWDARSWGGENVYDVYSLSPGRALDGTYYSEW